MTAGLSCSPDDIDNYSDIFVEKSIFTHDVFINISYIIQWFIVVFLKDRNNRKNAPAFVKGGMRTNHDYIHCHLSKLHFEHKTSV